MAEGAKYDGDKPQFSLLWDGMPNALLGVAQVLTFGAKKYAAHSWQTVPDNITRYQSALLRHQNAIARGETHDAESGLPHDFHVACNSLFLAELRERERLQRPDRSGAGHGEPEQSPDPVQGGDGKPAAGSATAPVPNGTAGLRGALDLSKLMDMPPMQSNGCQHEWMWMGIADDGRDMRSCRLCHTSHLSKPFRMNNG